MSDSVDVAYQALLGRDPDSDERAAAQRQGMIATAHALAASAEHGNFVTAAPAEGFVLAGTPRATAAHPVGSISADDVGMVGSDGRLLLHRGSNDFATQFGGRQALPDGWLLEWLRVLEYGRKQAESLGARLVQIVVPEKLAVSPEVVPGGISIIGPRPVEFLREAWTELRYPIDALRACNGHAFMAVDSHPSPLGGWALLLDVLAAAGLAGELAQPEMGEYLHLGDLGIRIAPRMIEAGRFPTPCTTLTVRSDNAPQMLAVGGHLGIHRTIVNPAAPHGETVLVFGDSVSFPPPGMPRGGLGDMLTRTFREVHFNWVPFGWDGALAEEIRPEVIVQEITERLIVTVPPVEVSVAAVAEATIARKAGFGIGDLAGLSAGPVPHPSEPVSDPAPPEPVPASPSPGSAPSSRSSRRQPLRRLLSSRR